MKYIKVVLCLTMLFVLHSVKAQVTTDGSEMRINTTTAHSQQNPAIAMDANGNYVVVWESYINTTNGYDIYFQRYNSSGVAQGSETIVNTTTADNQQSPKIAMADNGKFTIVWQSYNQDGEGHGIYAAMFNTDGTTALAEFLVNTTITGEQRQPSIAMENDGAYVISWISSDADGFGVFAQQFTNTGATVNSEFAVNSTTTGFQSYSDVAMDDSGNYIITWQSLNQDGSGNGVYFQRFNASGTAQGSETLVNTTITGNQQNPKIATDQNGNFVIVWESYGQDAANTYGIYAQRFNSDGTTNGSEIIVNSTTSNHQSEPAITMDKNGFYYITWSSYGTDGNFNGVYLQAYMSDGTASGTETLVNTRTTDFQQKAAMATEYDNAKLVIVWQDGLNNSSATDDGDDYGIYGQAYSTSAVLPVELLFFDGKKVELGVRLDWQTVSEINNSHFDVEWSMNGIDFEKIGEVEGNGTTTEVQFYEFLHENPVNGINYYRLKQHDFDGAFEYSDILNINFQFSIANSTIKIFPNPAAEFINIQANQVGELVQIIDIQGRVLQEHQLQATSNQYQVFSLPAGTYFVRIGKEVRKIIITK